jgi:hypothetical protein
MHVQGVMTEDVETMSPDDCVEDAWSETRCGNWRMVSARLAPGHTAIGEQS